MKEQVVQDEKYNRTTKKLQPGEIVEYEVILEWDRDAMYVENLKMQKQ